MSVTRIYTILLYVITLPAMGQQPRLILPRGHSETIITAEFSPDERKIVTASYDQTVKVWDRYTGALLVDLVGHQGSVLSAEFSPDGKTILTCSEDGSAIVWEVISGRIIAKLDKHKSEINTAHFSPDGKKIVTASSDNTLKTWQAVNGKLLMTISGHTDAVTFAKFSSNGQQIISASDDNSVRLWDAMDGSLIREFLGHSMPITWIELSPDEKKFISTSLDNSSKIWDIESGKVLVDLRPNAGYLHMASFSPDGIKVMTVSDDTCIIWNLLNGVAEFKLNPGPDDRFVFARFTPFPDKIAAFTGRGRDVIFDIIKKVIVSSFKGHVDDVTSCTFSRDGKSVLTASADATARIWNIADGTEQVAFTGQAESNYVAIFSPDGNKIATASSGSIVRIWNVVTGSVHMELKGHRLAVNDVKYNSSGSMLASGSYDSTIRIWNTLNGKNKWIIKRYDIHARLFEFSPKEDKILALLDNATAAIWDMNSGKVLMEFRGGIQFAKFSPDGNYVATYSSYDAKSEKLANTPNRMITIWRVADGKKLSQLAGYMSKPNFLQFSPDSKLITCTTNGRDVYVWDVQTGLVLHSLGIQSKTFQPKLVAFNKEGDNVIVSSGNIYDLNYGEDTKLRLWALSTSKNIVELEGNKAAATFLSFTPDGRKLVVATLDNKIYVFDAKNGKKLLVIDDFEAALIGLNLSPDSRKILTTSTDNTSRLWDVENGNLLLTLLNTQNGGFFAQIPSGYYHCSKEAAKYLKYIGSGLKVFSFEQLDIKYNRPDKLMEAMGNTDTALIRSYRRAWEKRLTKLRIDTTAFRTGLSLPEADFANRDEIGYEQNTDNLLLHIKASDKTYKIDRVNIWINESPIFGQRGINIRRKNTNKIDTTIAVRLSQGENRIETSITNVNGTESYRMPLVVNYTPPVRQKESLRFIGIGIDQFADPKNNLKYSSKDIRDLAIKLKEKYKEDIIIDTLFNEEVTTGNVKALKNKLQQSSVNDKVIISYSGHGLLNKEYDYYLSTYTMNFDKPEENGLPYEELENLLDSIPARKKLMLIDACHSGEVDKDEITRYEAETDSLNRHGTKGGDVRYTGISHVGMKNSFDLMQSLFVNVGKSTGATIISAAAGTQFALERGDLKNGVFTYSILEAMDKNPHMKVSELRKIVGERVVQLTNGLQKPTSRNETISADWNLW